MANLVTGIRIIASIALAGVPALSPGFYALYLLAGASDMIDGWVARRTGTASPLGARLDTLADFVFAAVCLAKLLPLLTLPRWMLVWIGVIAVIKLVGVLSGLIVQGRFVAEHTLLNKLTGLLLFAFPLALPVIDLKLAGGVVCAVATLAAVQEGHLIRTGKSIE